MEWSFRPISRQSAFSDTPFTEGEKIVCLIFSGEKPGELGRADVREDELGEFEVPGTVLGRWTRVVKSEADEAKEAQRLTVASAEVLFFSLFDEAGDDAGGESQTSASARQTLQHILALLLERRRILKPLGKRRSKAGFQEYLHVKEKKTFVVAVCSLTPDLILEIQDVLGEFVV